MLKSSMRLGWSLNRLETLPITPAVSILQLIGANVQRGEENVIYVCMHTNNVHIQEISPKNLLQFVL